MLILSYLWEKHQNKRSYLLSRIPFSLHLIFNYIKVSTYWKQKKERLIKPVLQVLCFEATVILCRSIRIIFMIRLDLEGQTISMYCGWHYELKSLLAYFLILFYLFLYLIYINLVQLAEIFLRKQKKIGNIDFSTCIMHIFQGHNKVNKAGVLFWSF